MNKINFLFDYIKIMHSEMYYIKFLHSEMYYIKFMHTEKQ